MFLGGEAGSRFLKSRIRLIESLLRQGQLIGILIELRLGRKPVGGELPGAVIGLLRERKIGTGAIDLGFAL